ncbi:MAG: molybdopterin-synthase adenylyltransferase MoeB [Chloroflexi bacterium]|nr:molybdopterin-synthase adenylyltransferase MoeB [Chloroflexota bacterium]MCL5108889.1 molybdopterin-synthase adenylyltransferase MoeB [Chloroflexota bacterium]
MDKKSSTRQQATPPERPARTFDEDQMQRYSRHIVLPEIGGIGQRSLLDGKVLIVGAGGLGSPLVLYLAAAGVGRLGIVDSDVVELSNLQRQVVHRTADVGRAKAEVAAEAARLLNPDVVAMPYAERLTSANALGVIAGYDVVVDASDNFPTRYLVNDACVLLGKPLVYGAVYRFDGQVSVFAPGQGCYRCLFPRPPEPGMIPSCAEGGVLGALPGVIGTIQAMEVLKILLGKGQTLAGRLLAFDGLSTEFRELSYVRDPDCPVCGDRPSVTEPIDYEAFCGLGAAATGR